MALLGYGHPRARWRRWLPRPETLFFQSNVGAARGPRPRRPRASSTSGPKGLTRAFLVNSGAEANENALRLAFRRTGRRRVVALEGAFHGRTAAAAAVTWGSERWYGFPQAPFDVTFVPRGDLEALGGRSRQMAAPRP